MESVRALKRKLLEMELRGGQRDVEGRRFLNSLISGQSGGLGESKRIKLEGGDVKNFITLGQLEYDIDLTPLADSGNYPPTLKKQYPIGIVSEQLTEKKVAEDGLCFWHAVLGSIGEQLKNIVRGNKHESWILNNINLFNGHNPVMAEELKNRFREKYELPNDDIQGNSDEFVNLTKYLWEELGTYLQQISNNDIAFIYFVVHTSVHHKYGRAPGATDATTPWFSHPKYADCVRDEDCTKKPFIIILDHTGKHNEHQSKGHYNYYARNTDSKASNHAEPSLQSLSNIFGFRSMQQRTVDGKTRFESLLKDSNVKFNQLDLKNREWQQFFAPLAPPPSMKQFVSAHNMITWNQLGIDPKNNLPIKIKQNELQLVKVDNSYCSFVTSIIKSLKAQLHSIISRQDMSRYLGLSDSEWRLYQNKMESEFINVMKVQKCIYEKLGYQNKYKAHNFNIQQQNVMEAIHHCLYTIIIYNILEKHKFHKRIGPTYIVIENEGIFPSLSHKDIECIQNETCDENSRPIIIVLKHDEKNDHYDYYIRKDALPPLDPNLPYYNTPNSKPSQSNETDQTSGGGKKTTPPRNSSTKGNTTHYTFSDGENVTVEESNSNISKDNDNSSTNRHSQSTISNDQDGNNSFETVESSINTVPETETAEYWQKFGQHKVSGSPITINMEQLFPQP